MLSCLEIDFVRDMCVSTPKLLITGNVISLINKFYSFIWQLVVISSECGLRIEVQLVRLSYCFTSRCFHFYSCLKQLCLYNKAECFSNCTYRHRMCIEAFKRDLAWVTDKRLWIISKTVMSPRN